MSPPQVPFFHRKGFSHQVHSSGEGYCAVFIEERTESLQDEFLVINFPLQHILELTMSSMIIARRSISCPQSPVGLHEIFDVSHNSTTADFREREELSNMRICVNLPNEVQDWEGLRSALAAEGMEITVKDDILCVSGYASRNDYDYQREIRATVAIYRRGSKSSS